MDIFKKLTRIVFIDLILLFIFIVINQLFLFIPYSPANIITTCVTLIIFDCCIFILYSFKTATSKKTHIRTSIAIISLTILIYLGFVTINSSVFRAEDYRNLAGDIKSENFSDDISHVDMSKLPIIHTDLAINLADKKIGELNLGSQMQVGTMTLQTVGENFYYVAPLEFNGFFKWNDKKTTPGYIMVNATKENDVKLVTNINGKELKLKYLKNSFFGDNLNRLSFKYAQDKYKTDYTFEIDDNGNPYWVISLYEKSFIFGGDKVTGTLIIDAQTGESNTYSIENTPSWVDRIQPLSIVDKNINYWGRLVHGFFNFSKRDMLQSTEGYKIIYNNGECFYYTGITSVSSDSSLNGFILTNSKTGESKFYKVSGAIETASQGSAQGKVQEKGYDTSFPILINIQNSPTYFMTYLDKQGLIKGYSFVNVENYNQVAIGDTLNSAYENYVKLLVNNSGSLQNEGKLVEKKGTIDRIGLSMNGDDIIYNITLVGDKTLYRVSSSNNEVTLTKPKESVVLKYIDNNLSVKMVQEFDNLSLDFN